MNRLLLAASTLTLMGAAACSDNTPAVVEPTAPMAPATAPAMPVTETTATTAATSAALAFGLTRDELEDADLLSSNNVDMGDVETLIINAAGDVTDLVVELDGPGDRKVVVPLAQVTSLRQGDDADLVTTLTADQLSALPTWNPSAAR